MEEQLAKLQEIPLPEPVSYTPQTIGWYILLALALVCIFLLIAKWIRQTRRNRYRKEALYLLTEIEQDKRTLAELPALVKRVSLASNPRKEVAGLNGVPWLEFLDSTWTGKNFSTGPGKILPLISYRPPEWVEKEVSAEERQALFDLIRTWIRRHRADI